MRLNRPGRGPPGGKEGKGYRPGEAGTFPGDKRHPAVPAKGREMRRQRKPPWSSCTASGCTPPHGARGWSSSGRRATPRSRRAGRAPPPRSRRRGSHPEQVAGKGIDDVVGHYAGIIRGLSAPPIVIGHSFGGLIVQRLLGQNLAAAGVAIDAAPVKGVYYLPASALRVASIALRKPANREQAVSLTASPVPLRLRERTARAGGLGSVRPLDRALTRQAPVRGRPWPTSLRSRRPRWTPATRTAARCC